MHLEDFTLHPSGMAPYRIRMSAPQGTPPSSGWPLVILLGAEGFDIAMAQVRYHAACQPPGYINDAVLVSVDYPGASRRRLDYTPHGNTAPANSPADAACPPEADQGGAPQFLHFLQNMLIDAIESRAVFDKTRVTLAGHSLGGLFTLYALFGNTPLFSSFIASSPSVWWGERYLQRTALSYDPPADTPRRELLITVGEYEQAVNPLEVRQQRPNLAELERVRAQRAMIAGNREVARLLSSKPGLEVGFQVLPGQSHRSAWPLALHYGLMQMLRNA
ncbi:alpha/beta hydrolase [Paracandidimonas soli]|uniref:Esterase n=1 Tax=Paracandidimonas soli TaxID=1917182 RepID=A0A4R3V483_9BURK|nr:alpha/beta hydrolase-fold protein [Paracandidimonas soli]TCU97124.1 hypothetical protein EV686_1062 [Paracandidimonas soli]